MSRRHHQRSRLWKLGTFLASLVLAGLTLGFGPLAPHAHRAQVDTAATPSAALSLEISHVQLGQVVEIKGLVSSKSAVMVNGDVVPLIGDDGSFTYFTPPLHEGENLLTVTAQDQHGQSITRQLHIDID